MFLNIAKGTTDLGVDCFNQSFWFDLVGSVWWVAYGLFGSVGLLGYVW